MPSPQKDLAGHRIAESFHGKRMTNLATLVDERLEVHKFCLSLTHFNICAAVHDWLWLDPSALVAMVPVA